jgi:hypothetical protein
MIFEMWMTLMGAPELGASSSRIGRGTRASFGSFLEAVRRGLRNPTLSASLVDELDVGGLERAAGDLRR